MRFETQAQFIRWNEEMAHRYDPESYHLRSGSVIRWLERRRVRAIVRMLDPIEGRVLEVGCGAGNVLEQIPTGELYGIDLSAFLIEKCRVRLANRDAELARADGERLPFADGVFDALVCTEVLEHVPEPPLILREMARVARSGAPIVVSVPNERWIDGAKRLSRAGGVDRLLMGRDGSGYRPPERMSDEWHLHRFDLRLLRAVSRGIVAIQEVRRVPYAWLPLRYVVRCAPLRHDTGVPIEARTPRAEDFALDPLRVQA